jgi:glyoxylase-like metal-dependent hydrolase (beta-lactamase superfamily II)
MSWEAARIDLGGLQLAILDGGSFRLDGASVYGVLPRVFWERKNRPDEDNRVLLATAPAVVETPEGVGIIDPGLGDGWGIAAADRYDLQGQRRLSEMLSEAGVAPEDVVGIIATHLHFDHVSAAVSTPYEVGAEDASPRVWAGDQAADLEPALPASRFYVQEREMAAARQPELRTASFVTAAVCTAYQKAGRLELLAGNATPFPGIEVEVTGGHTPGHQVVWLKGSNQTVLMAGDLLPTTTHLRGEVTEGLDFEPSVSSRAKAGLLARAVESGAVLTFYHAPRVRWGRLRAGLSGKYELGETFTVSPARRAVPGVDQSNRSEKR